eukprot:943565-Pelagomonas_calceolata.AAC.1
MSSAPWFKTGRNTLQSLFILRHLKHAVETLQPRGSPRLYATCIESKQVYDSIPRDRPWEHLNKCQMPIQLISIIKDLYQDERKKERKKDLRLPFGRVH